MSEDKIGIFCSEQSGDMLLCTAVLKYKDILWPGKDVVWYCSLSPERANFLDNLKYNDLISEVREWPNEFFRTLMDGNGQLILNRRADFENMKDLHNGYFPAPWAALPNNALNAVNYANIPRLIFGADPSWEWHPYLCFSDEEREAAKDFCLSLPHRRTIMLETQLKSAGNFILAEDTTRDIMQECRNKFGQCNFIFASKVDNEKFIDDTGVVSCSHFTIRQCALIHNYCDLFIGVCSGITQAVSCWGNLGVPRVELCGSMIVSSIVANGPVNSVICDNWSLSQMRTGFVRGVENTLSKF